MSPMNKPYDLEERLIDFAVDVIDVVEVLPDSKAGNHIANQLVRSVPRKQQIRKWSARRNFPFHKS